MNNTTPTNINWTQLIGLIAMVAAFIHPGFTIPADIQTALVVAIGAATTVITWIMHTFVNPPMTGLRPPGKLGFSKHAAHLLLVFVVGGLAVGGLQRCAMVQDWVGGSGKQLGQLLVLGKGGQTTYISLCSPVPKPSYCPDPATGKRASHIFTSVAVDAVGTYEAHGDTAALLSALERDVADIVGMINEAKARSGKPQLGVTEIVTIIQLAIQLGPQLWADFKAISGVPTDEQLNGWVQAIRDNDARIQLM